MEAGDGPMPGVFFLISCFQSLASKQNQSQVTAQRLDGSPPGGRGRDIANALHFCGNSEFKAHRELVAIAPATWFCRVVAIS